MMCKCNIMKVFCIILIIVYVSEASGKSSDHPEENLRDFYMDENIFNKANLVRNAPEPYFGAKFDIAQLQPIRNMKRKNQNMINLMPNLGIKIPSAIAEEMNKKRYCPIGIIACNIIKIQEQIGAPRLTQICLEDCMCWEPAV